LSALGVSRSPESMLRIPSSRNRERHERTPATISFTVEQMRLRRKKRKMSPSATSIAGDAVMSGTSRSLSLLSGHVKGRQ
jgi:hypothetical protein